MHLETSYIRSFAPDPRWDHLETNIASPSVTWADFQPAGPRRRRVGPAYRENKLDLRSTSYTCWNHVRYAACLFDISLNFCTGCGMRCWWNSAVPTAVARVTSVLPYPVPTTNVHHKPVYMWKEPLDIFASSFIQMCISCRPDWHERARNRKHWLGCHERYISHNTLHFG